MPTTKKRFPKLLLLAIMMAIFASMLVILFFMWQHHQVSTETFSNTQQLFYQRAIFISILILIIITIFTFFGLTQYFKKAFSQLNKRIDIINDETERQLQVSKNHIQETDEMWQKFSEISKQLHETYLAVKESNRILQETVAERTRELLEANNELLKLSNTDNLTNLANRRNLDELLMNYWKQLERSEIQSIAFMMCDIDCFKQYNDTYGHLAGDHCLQKVAQMICRTIRKTDVVARYGGEEFVLVMPKAQAENAERVAKAIQNMLYEMNIEHTSSPVSDRVTISIGIAVATAENLTNKDDLVSRADAALYHAKNSGRNSYAIDGKSYKSDTYHANVTNKNPDNHNTSNRKRRRTDIE